MEGCFFRILFELRQLILYLMRLLFSFLFEDCKCICCGSKCYVIPLCSVCKDKMRNIVPPEKKRCSVCGKILVSEENLCLQCRNHGVLSCTDGCFPLYSYRMWNKKLLFEWKMAGVRTLSPFFADLLACALKMMFPGVSFCSMPVLVPVPPRKGKIKKKGWDQIQDLCFHLHGKYGIRIFDCLERVSTVQQKKLDRKQRIEGKNRNYEAGKKLIKACSRGVVPEEVIILDDVITTGSTIDGCSSILKEAGVRKVHALSLFIVD